MINPPIYDDQLFRPTLAVSCINELFIISLQEGPYLWISNEKTQTSRTGYTAALVATIIVSTNRLGRHSQLWVVWHWGVCFMVPPVFLYGMLAR